MGEMALEAGDLNKAEECLNKAKSYKKYDWETCSATELQEICKRSAKNVLIARSRAVIVHSD
jgi:hypothetical protein